jgi:hypothetical protein
MIQVATWYHYLMQRCLDVVLFVSMRVMDELVGGARG